MKTNLEVFHLLGDLESLHADLCRRPSYPVKPEATGVAACLQGLAPVWEHREVSKTAELLQGH